MSADAGNRAGMVANAVTLLIVVVAAAGLWVATMSAYENILFSKGTTQILGVVSRARDLMKGTAVVMRPGEDVLELFKRERFMSGVYSGPGAAYLNNPWESKTTARMDSPVDLRIETAVPARVCRRMVEFFGKEASGVGFVKAEARDQDGAVGRQMFVAPKGQQRYSISSTAIEIGCGKAETAILTLVFTVK